MFFSSNSASFKACSVPARQVEILISVLQEQKEAAIELLHDSVWFLEIWPRVKLAAFVMCPGKPALSAPQHCPATLLCCGLGCAGTLQSGWDLTLTGTEFSHPSSSWLWQELSFSVLDPSIWVLDLLLASPLCPPWFFWWLPIRKEILSLVINPGYLFPLLKSVPEILFPYRDSQISPTSHTLAVLVMGQVSLGFLAEKPPNQTLPHWRRGLPSNGFFFFFLLFKLERAFV